MDWDDDELATAIYDKPSLPSSPGALGAIGQGSGLVDHQPLSPVATAAPSPSGNPSPFDSPSSPPPSSPPGAPSPFSPIDPVAPVQSKPPPKKLREPTAVTRQPSDRKSNMPLVVGSAVVLLLVLAGVAWYVLKPPAPGTIQLATEPADPVVLFDETPVPATASPFVIANVAPGPHLIEVRKRGYRTWSTQVELAPGQDLRLPDVRLVAEDGAAPSSSTGGFTLASSPPGATVFVDGAERPERTPVTLNDIPAGTHTIRLELEGRAPWEDTINVPAGQLVAVPQAELGPARVTVRFASDPSGAQVTLVRGSEERRVGRTPTRSEIDLSGDQWTVRVERAGYATWAQPLDVPAGAETLTVEAELERERVAVRTPRMVRNPPVRRDPPPVMEETMAAAVMMGGGGGTGTLRINTRPWSQVYVDGRLIGNTPQMNIQLSSGRHRVTLVNPEFDVRHTVSVNIQAGETTTRIVPLPIN